MHPLLFDEVDLLARHGCPDPQAVEIPHYTLKLVEVKALRRPMLT
jgi:hypothetical protein